MTIAEVALSDFLAYAETLSEQDQADAFYLRHRDDLALFACTYFPERFTSPYNALHRDLASRPKTPWHERARMQRSADAAPRGAAKSTLESFASIVHDACYGFELYVALISTTYDLAEDLVEDLHGVFTDPEGYEDLHRDYGPFRVKGTRTDFVVHVPGQDPRGMRVKAFSFGGTIRGTKHAGVRPTKIGIDDGEHPEKVRSPDQRAKTWAFLTKDIQKAGRNYTVIRVVGTVLHADSMLANLLSAPAWTSTRWRSIISWPTRMDLWERCRLLWADLTDANRVETAQAFYEANRSEMNAGAEVLWEEEEPLFDLMEQWWEDPAAFYSEKQNEPRDPTRQVFDVEDFKRCHFDGVTITAHGGRKVRLRDCTVRLWLDPSIGKKMGSDFAALAALVRDTHGYRYVLKCQLLKAPPSQQRAITWDLWEMMGGTSDVVLGVEDNGFQALYGEDFKREQDQRRRDGRVWSMAVRQYTSSENKEDRISRLEPAAVNGWLQFADDLDPRVLEQFRDFPTGSHDDGPDAIERADWMLSEGSGMAVARSGPSLR